MSRHRDLPRATLSSSTPLQSHQKDMLRQHFAKFHHSHPEQTTLYIISGRPRHPARPATSSCTADHVIQHDQPRHPVRPTTSSCTASHVILYVPPSHPTRPATSSCTFHQVIQHDQPRHPELVSGSLSNHPVIQSRFCSCICNWRAGIFAKEVTTQHNGLPSPASKSAPGQA
jgi:hypothetical protein